MKIRSYNPERSPNLSRAALSFLSVTLIAIALAADWIVTDSTPGFGPHQILLLIIGCGLFILSIALPADKLPKWCLNACILTLSTILTTLAIEMVFHAIGYDFD